MTKQNNYVVNNKGLPTARFNIYFQNLFTMPNNGGYELDNFCFWGDLTEKVVSELDQKG